MAIDNGNDIYHQSFVIIRAQMSLDLLPADLAPASIADIVALDSIVGDPILPAVAQAPSYSQSGGSSASSYITPHMA